MRTTIDLPEDVLQEAKVRATHRRVTVSKVLGEAIRSSFARDAAAATNITVQLPTFGSGGVRPGVDLADNASLLDLMDGPE